MRRELSKTIRQKREQLLAIRREVEDLIDYLEVLEARTRDQNKQLRMLR
jgi:tRNA U34 5-carboxymethylaminomethyl modifying GTPase MnmE/TrmE